MLRPPRVRVALAISASGEWKPQARRVSWRKWVLVASERAFETAYSRVFRIARRCSSTVLAIAMNSGIWLR